MCKYELCSNNCRLRFFSAWPCNMATHFLCVRTTRRVEDEKEDFEFDSGVDNANVVRAYSGKSRNC